jgi:ribosome-associated heat shock protein Hsp15
VSPRPTSAASRVRVDRWLWTARFFKTRSLASEAIDGGRVHVNGDRVKAAWPLKPGDRLEVRRGQEVVGLVVVALAEQRRMLATAAPRLVGRPDRRSRRLITRTKRGSAR